ncbi:M48 family metallopeptidase [Deinococcus roseus]|uniref:Peptidase M48 domain-containing protein n=1 Tax=Deinococcus roseus TaxID=392414 RepID=A0ABQ2CZI0_9DEIO|nr:M48 family metallopeptidase [Deinococcus roseus]GGJ35883.1 hypothetical protein GCM10008938_22500 [Deinococcus roseus]
MYAVLGKKSGKQLFEKHLKQPVLKPGWSFSKMLGFFLAGLLVFPPYGLMLVGVGLALYFHSDPAYFACAGLLALGWYLQSPILQRPHGVVTREQAPVLYGVLDQIARLQNTRIDHLAVQENFNASFLRVEGWHGKAVVALGYPLMSILTPEEKVAVMAHEVAHSANGDALRSGLVGMALGTLQKWTIIWYRLNLPIEPLIWHGQLILLCFHRDSQRAEYLADDLAAAVAGSEAMVSALKKLHFAPNFHSILRAAADSSNTMHFYRAFQQHIRHVPDSELRRIERAGLLEGSRVDDSHPPTVYRIQRLNTHFKPSALQLTPEQTAAIDRELQTLEADLQGFALAAWRDVMSR